MNTESPKQLSLIIAFISSIIAVLLYSFFCYFSPLQSIVYSILILWVIFLGINYLFSVYFIQKFIDAKIKILFKTIKKSKSKSEQSNLNGNNDIFNKVNLEVQKWVNENETQKKNLEIKEAFSREYIGNVAHELKTPIFNIQGYILTLLEGGLEDSTINRKYLERTEKSVSRMIDLVEDLDQISKLESGKVILNIKKINLVELTNEVFEALEENAKENNVKLKFNKVYESPVWVMCDKAKIYQVLYNLILNSIKYANVSNPAITEVRFFKIEDVVLVEVSDNGIGIEEIHLPRLFERFYRIESSRSRDQGGSGLGLAIVKHIIDAHNQTINVRSTIGLGSTFSFTLQKA
jgi:two-component system, OmpR family, phosphate regulon sensor histidine kinase PhoR